MKKTAFLLALFLPSAAMAQQQQPTPEQVANAQLTAVWVNHDNLQNSLRTLTQTVQHAAAENALLRKQLSDVLEKCGDACKKPEPSKDAK